MAQVITKDNARHPLNPVRVAAAKAVKAAEEKPSDKGKNVKVPERKTEQ